MPDNPLVGHSVLAPTSTVNQCMHWQYLVFSDTARSICATQQIPQPSWSRCPQATLAAANVAAVLRKYPVASKPDVLKWVDGEFEAVPKAAPSIVNATDLGLEVQS